ncbi:MAG: hypothetical protein QME81_20155, partial [bacterium]|nr:hypothetical protein [bacterium]
AYLEFAYPKIFILRAIVIARGWGSGGGGIHKVNNCSALILPQRGTFPSVIPERTGVSIDYGTYGT